MQNKWIRYGLISLGIFLVTGGVFSAGLFVGRWSVRGTSPAAPLFQRGFLFSGSHGATGVIEDIQGKTLTIKLRDDTTQIVLTDNNTRFERNLKKATLGDLKTGDKLLIVGAPDEQGQIKARLIRIIEPRSPTPTPGR